MDKYLVLADTSVDALSRVEYKGDNRQVRPKLTSGQGTEQPTQDVPMASNGQSSNNGAGQGPPRRAPRGGVKRQANNNAVQSGQVEATLENHRKMLLRLENSRRQDARDNNLVVEIGPKEQTLRAALHAAGNIWKTERPEKGAHPDGPIHEVQFKVFIKSLLKTVTEQLAAMEPDYDSNEGKAVQHQLKTLLATKDSPAAMFHALGKRGKEPHATGVWLWVMRIKAIETEHNQFRQWFHTEATRYKFGDTKIREDYGPMDALARETAALSFR